MPTKVEDEVKEKKVKNNSAKGKATKTDLIGKIKEKSVKKKEKDKKVATKKTVAKKEKEKKENVKSKNTKSPEAVSPKFFQEYYDLPYRYNETIVTILAQTPKRLFVYWDISDKDRESYKKAFGDDFFEKTYPVLLVHNEEMDYTFEVPINDFANSWYLDIQDSKKNYVVQLGRKFRNVEQARKVDLGIIKEEHINFQNDFIYITDSNRLESPNDHILFELLTNKVKYRNVKTGEEYTKNLKEMASGLANLYPASSLISPV